MSTLIWVHISGNKLCYWIVLFQRDWLIWMMQTNLLLIIIMIITIHHHDQQEGWGSQSSGWSWRRIWFRGLEQGWLLVILQNHHLNLQKKTKPFF